MAKHKCPSCKKRFDYEQYGWKCPYCHYIILGSTEANVMQQERIELQNKKRLKNRRKSEVTEYLKSRVFIGSVTILLVFVLLLGIGVGTKVPKIITLKNKTQGRQEITQLDAKMNEIIHIGSFTIKITEAFWLDCDEVPEPKSGSYLAVRYQTGGKNKDDAMQRLSDIAWTGLHSIASDVYLLPLYTSDIVGSDETSRRLLKSGVANSLGNADGILIFLVTDKRQSYELCLFSGEENGYNQYSVLVSERHTVPLEIKEQAGDILS